MCVCVRVRVCVRTKILFAEPYIYIYTDLQKIFLYIPYLNLPSLFPVFKRTQSKPHKPIIAHYGNIISYSLVVSYITVVVLLYPILFR